MRPTMKDVALHAGVSAKTVSNVMNGVVFVRPDTRERVESAITDLGYVPNLSARGLRTGRSGVIALAMPTLSTPYSAEMAHYFVEVAHELGWAVQFEETGREPDRTGELLSRAREHLVDGVILNPVTSSENAIITSSPSTPVVTIGEVYQASVDRVWVDSHAAVIDMMAHLISLGHSRIAAVGTPGANFDMATAHARVGGYRAALARAHLTHDPRLELTLEHWTPGAAAAAVTSHVTRHGLPDAFFCFTDSIALGTMSALWSLGARVPDDVSVAGFDDIVDGQFASPPLTTVSFDKRHFAERTVGLLADRIAAPGAAPTMVTIDHQIAVRWSTAPPSRR